MAYTTIDDPSAYFQTAIYTGNNTTDHNITNDGNSDLQPDFVWIKQRTSNNPHMLQDSSRGFAGNGEVNVLQSNSTGAEATNGAFESFNTDGFGVGGTNVASGAYNLSGSNYVAWQWKVNGGTTTSLTSNINSVCQVNQDAGISIVKYTCTGGGNGQSVKHGLGLVPQVIITKNRTDTSYSDWITYHHTLTKDNFVKLNTDAPSATNSPYNGANPTSSTYNVSIDLVEQKDYVSYVFAPIQGYSKFGSYIGNGNADGPFVYTGFKPAFVMIKPVTNSGYNWVMMDSARNPTNTIDKYIWADLANAEYDGTGISLDVDFLSNGFKLTTSRGEVNLNTASNIYMAFAENPLVTSTGIPTTAR